ncbi:MAG: AmmeMemoRadiSam system protein B [Candidatus Binatia bacterium]
MAATQNCIAAGTFYPADATRLRRTITEYLNVVALPGPPPKALIVPHSGYLLCGTVAASAYVSLAALRRTITRVVLLGPAHWTPFTGLATTRAKTFLTPLGMVSVKQKSVTQALSLPFVHIMEEAYAREHGIEVQLPFLQEVLEDFSLVPLLVGDAPPEQITEALDLLWGGPETLIIISSDLSHYYDYSTARRMDYTTAQAIEMLQPQHICAEHACGWRAIQGLLFTARKHGMQAKTVVLRNSADTDEQRTEVVGYGSFLFTKEHRAS